MQEILERLAAARIQLLPLTQLERHWVFERDGFISLVERTIEGGFGNIGAPGLWTERGMAVLTRRGNGHVFAAKGYEVAATIEQVETLRRFAGDLEAALSAAPSKRT